MADIEFILNMDGKTVVLTAADLKCVRIDNGSTGKLLIMPGVVVRSLSLGAAAILEEQHTRARHEVAKDCTIPPRPISEKAEAL